MKRGAQSKTIVSTQLVKTYMDQKYRTAEKDSYDRIYTQVVDFANQYQEQRIEKLKAIGLTRSVKKIQFPAESVDPVLAYLISTYDKLKHLKESKRITQRKAKCLGK